MKGINVIMVVFAFIFSLDLRAQENAPVQALADFDFIVEKIRKDYPGYADKVTPGLFELEKDCRGAITDRPDSILFYIDKYLSFFADSHLSVRRVAARSSAPARRRTPPVVALKAESLSAIEGIWKSFDGTVSIEKNGNSYRAVAVDYDGAEKGEVVYEFVTAGARSSLVASLELDGKVLDIHRTNVYFIRPSGSDIFDDAFLNTYHPAVPSGRNNFWWAQTLTDSTFYMRIPNFQNERMTKAIISNNWDNITSRPNLIIDIRTNTGGQDYGYEAILPLLYAAPYEVKGVEWYASDGNIESFEQALEEGDIREGREESTLALIEAMKKNRGGFIVHPEDTAVEIVEYDTIYPYPRNVGIIIDKTNASAAEQFLLAAKNSGKVILFGNDPTAGTLDYSNTVPHTTPSGKYDLRIPMTRSLRLPENPIDGTGIAPDIAIPFPENENLFDRVDDWVYFVMYYLETV